jgi:hypothetical protein
VQVSDFTLLRTLNTLFSFPNITDLNQQARTALLSLQR